MRPRDVARDALEGLALESAREDHQHQGLHSMIVDSEAVLGDVTLAGGTAIELAFANETLTFSLGPHAAQHEDGGSDALTGANIEGIVRAALAAASATISFNSQDLQDIGNITVDVRAIFGNGGDATLGWETVETTDTLKFFAKSGAFIFSQFTGNAGYNKYGASPPPAMSLVVHADDADATHRIQLGHDTTDSYIDSITGDLKLLIGGVEVVSIESALVAIAQSTTLADGASLSLQEDITFTGATTENLIKMPDNLAVALDITEGANSYQKFVTTDGAEAVAFGKPIELHVAGPTGIPPQFFNLDALANWAMLGFYPGSGTNVTAHLSIIPKGTGGHASVKSQMVMFATDYVADSTNTEWLGLRATGSSYTIGSGSTGSGSDRAVYIGAGLMSGNNTNQLVLAVDGKVGINAVPSYGFDVNGTFRVVSTSLMQGTLTLSGAANQILLNHVTSNWIRWRNAGYAAPAFGVRSAGTKLVLVDTVAAAAVDYGLGVEAYYVWFSTPQATSSYGFKWYGGTTELCRLGGDGLLTVGSLVFSDGGSTVDIIRDEDNMASDDDAALATQQSIKAYVDGVGGEANVDVCIRKDDDEPTNNDATLNDDSELLFAVGDGEEWVMDAVLYMACSTNCGIKVAVNGPTATKWYTVKLLSAADLSYVTGGSKAVWDGDETDKTLTAYMVHIHLSLVASAAGNVVVRWCQETSHADFTTMKAGSYLVAHREA